MNPYTVSPWLTREVDRLTAPWHPGAATFTRALAAAAPTTSVAQIVAASLGVHPSTAMSRLDRAGLPSPKEQLALFRLSLAVELAQAQQWPVKRVGNALDYSSPQSFGRHIRDRLGVTAREFFNRWTRDDYWRLAVAPVMQWDDERWTRLDVLEGNAGRYLVTTR